MQLFHNSLIVYPLLPKPLLSCQWLLGGSSSIVLYLTAYTYLQLICIKLSASAHLCGTGFYRISTDIETLSLSLSLPLSPHHQIPKWNQMISLQLLPMGYVSRCGSAPCHWFGRLAWRRIIYHSGVGLSLQYNGASVRYIHTYAMRLCV